MTRKEAGDIMQKYKGFITFITGLLAGIAVGIAVTYPAWNASVQTDPDVVEEETATTELDADAASEEEGDGVPRTRNRWARGSPTRMPLQLRPLRRQVPGRPVPRRLLRSRRSRRSLLMRPGNNRVSSLTWPGRQRPLLATCRTLSS